MRLIAPQIASSPAAPEVELGPLAWCLVALALGIPALALGFAVMQPWWPVGDLLRDPLNVAEGRMSATGSAEGCCGLEVGVLSLYGNLLTAATAGVMAFAALLRHRIAGRVEAGVLLLALGALLSAVMAFDDLYRIHEETHEKGFVAFYAAAFSAVALVSLFRLGRFELRFLAGSAGFFALSVVIDLALQDSLGPLRVFYEDGAKLFGLSCWAAFGLAAGMALTTGERR